MKIAIAGAGRIGSTLGRLWAAKGHDITLTFSRDESALAATAKEIGATSAQPAEAMAQAEVVLLAVPGNIVEEAISALGTLDGKVLIDATNFSGQPGGPSGAEKIAQLAPGAHVVKAVNTVFSPMFPLASQHPGRADMLIAGDDAQAKETVSQLMSDFGFRPVDAGGLDAASDMEAFARLVINLAYKQGRGPFTYRFAPPNEQ